MFGHGWSYKSTRSTRSRFRKTQSKSSYWPLNTSQNPTELERFIPWKGPQVRHSQVRIYFIPSKG